MTVAFVLHRADDAPVSTAFRRAAFGKSDPFARHREIAWDGPDSMAAGRASFIGELDVKRSSSCKESLLWKRPGRPRWYWVR